jgi:hypothetical protein
MSALLDKAVDHLAKQVDDRSAGWLASGIVRGRQQLLERPPALVQLAGAELDLSDLGLQLLDAAEEEQAGLADFGRAKFLDAVVLTGLGRKDEARRRWLREEASFAQIIAAGEADDARALAEAKRRKEAWEAFERFAAKAGMAAIRFGVPLLLAAL